MDDAERQRSAYRRVLRALDEAVFCLERESPEEAEDRNAEQQGTFRLGEAGGIAFCSHLAGIDCGALCDEISDAVEAEDPDRIRQVRSGVESRLRSGEDAAADASEEGALDWDAGYLQFLAVLNESRQAREEGDAHRYWIMAGFLAGLLQRDGTPGQYERGALSGAVIAACNEGWGETLWMEWEAIRDEWLAGDSPAAPEDPDLLLRWLGLRLAAAESMADSLVSGHVAATNDDRREGEPDDGARFLRCERSTRRAQNFGARIARRNEIRENDPRT
ncbi:hypothetical protein [Candidatus Palauibacter soopunensis]|uniref:hypothetical protein n=1 Tax=Candidatus Palauibacter soopunensis TaxID=3056739 RepID=UPI0023A28E10|nr:hypothetical protein [Candidatus Palauibacter soopunensis]MDE2879379.1 hypothetical protein [Candidatus Palauibacter soopunensis]